MTSDPATDVILDAMTDWRRLVDTADVPFSFLRRALAQAGQPATERLTWALLERLVDNGILEWGTVVSIGGVRDVRLVEQRAVPA